MITLYLVNTICSALMLTCDVFILVRPQLPGKKYPIFFLSFWAFFLIQAYFGFYPILFVSLAVNSFLLVTFTRSFHSLFYIPTGYMINCMLGNIMVLITSVLSGLSFRELNASAFTAILDFACTIMLSCPLLWLIRRLYERYLSRIFEKMSKKLLTLLALNLMLCAFMLFILASFFDNMDITRSQLFLMISTLVLYFLFTTGMIFIVLYFAKNNYEARKKADYLESLNDYTKNLEMVYHNLRSFKHDYINIMASLAAYIDEKKYEELGDFFYEHILPMQKNLTHKNEALNNLSNIHILELKSILYTKLLLALNQDIEVHIDIPDEIDSIHMDPVDLTRMLGIYLDNAIEACLETQHPAIHFHLGKMNRDVVMILSNTFVDKGLSVAQMYKMGASTKGSGHGIGLHNVTQILNRYDHIYHETAIKDDLFIQQVQIS